jgi:transketolase
VHEDFKAKLGARGGKLRGEWMALFSAYEKAYPELAAETLSIHTVNRQRAGMQRFRPSRRMRRGSRAGILQARCSTPLPSITRGSLAVPWISLRAFGSGFLIFSDYGKASLRLAAIMELPVIYLFTHDSIGVGEDGPTHQPVEHLAALRSIPGLVDIRPCDANEVAEAWRVIMESKHEPVALILSRQALPTLDRSKHAPASGLRRGAYILSDATDGKPDVLLLATGSEVSLCIGAQEVLKNQGLQARVISMPSWKLFEDQDEAYRESVIPSNIRARVSVEQAARFGWERYVGIDGARIGMRTFGESTPLQKLVKKFGFTVDAVVAAALEQVNRTSDESSVRTSWT